MLRQQGRTGYYFEKWWGRSGGPLYGDNFFTDLCTNGIITHDSMKCELSSSEETHVPVWEFASLDTDPDYLLYMWKKGRNERFDFYIQESEIIFLTEFYRRHNLLMMLGEVYLAAERIQASRGCVLL
jgi:hypothetical protein